MFFLTGIGHHIEGSLSYFIYKRALLQLLSQHGDTERGGGPTLISTDGFMMDGC